MLQAGTIDRCWQFRYNKSELKIGKIVASDVSYIGKINRNLFTVISDKIITDEVIITDERIKHIIDRRGQAFFDKYCSYFSEIISKPDYIFKDERKHTALVCKSVIDKGATINLVIWLAVEGDNYEFKNSIITAIKENNRRFNQRIRNGDLIYKRGPDNDE